MTDQHAVNRKRNKLASFVHAAIGTSRIGTHALGAISAVAAGAVLVASGIASSIQDTFVVMGLDPDRARLCAALAVVGVGAFAGGLVGGRQRESALLGPVLGAGVFGRTFVHETRASLASKAPAGIFDPMGWATSLVALVVVGLVLAWSAASIGVALRTELARAWATRGADTQARERDRHRLVGVTVWVAILLIVGGSFTVLADMLNYSPDVQMLRGGPALPALVDRGPGPGGPNGAPLSSFGPGPSTAPVPSGSEAFFSTGPIPGTLITPGALSEVRPWFATLPSGVGTQMRLSFPAPWSGAGSTQIPVDVYLPPGYETGHGRYPVTYFVPWSFHAWETTTHIVEQLDGLITSGAIPAQIAIFVQAAATGPYPDSQCADSADHRVWWDRYLTQTVLAAIDTQFRTRPGPAFRSVVGLSEGGYCAATLLARHPDLFGQAASISGYFDAAPASNQTVSARLVFGGDQVLIDAASPELIVRSLPTAVRQAMFFVLAANPAEPFYGPYYSAFASELARLAIPCALVPDTFGHSAIESRTAIGPILRLLAGRLARSWG